MALEGEFSVRAITFVAITILAPAILFAGNAHAQDNQPAPEVFTNVVKCRAITDDAERLACFDSAVGRLETAQASEELVVVSREQVEETRRGLFGLTLPKIKLFGGGDENEVKELSSTVASFARTPRGGWVVTLDDGAVWAQTDNTYVGTPKVGESIVIKKAALGSFMAKIDGGRAFRIERRN